MCPRAFTQDRVLSYIGILQGPLRDERLTGMQRLVNLLRGETMTESPRHLRSFRVTTDVQSPLFPPGWAVRQTHGSGRWKTCLTNVC
mmetsp:Transcript_41873/g.132030  ORF Transcript_41873/g.132030 Transcript_41873/m.132030 type:complete len:87 (+) Transcript_41873:1156-1416(+)